MFCRMLAKLTNPAGSRIPPTVGEPPGLAAGLAAGNGIGTLLCGLFRLVPTTLFLYLRNQSTPNSSSLFKVSSPIIVLSATCGDFTSISSRIFMTFTTTSRLPKTMMVFARWSAMILALPTVTALGAVSTGWVESSSEILSSLPVAVLEFSQNDWALRTGRQCAQIGIALRHGHDRIANPTHAPA